MAPKFAAVLKVAQFKVEALKGAVGPRPPWMGLNAVPVPAGIAKQLVQTVPSVAVKPAGAVAEPAGSVAEPVEVSEDLETTLADAG